MLRSIGNVVSDSACIEEAEHRLRLVYLTSVGLYARSIMRITRSTHSYTNLQSNANRKSCTLKRSIKLMSAKKLQRLDLISNSSKTKKIYETETKFCHRKPDSPAYNS